MTGFSRTRLCLAYLLPAMLLSALAAPGQASGKKLLNEVRARAVSTLLSDIFDAGAADPALSWLAGDNGAIRLSSQLVAGSGGNVSWAMLEGPEWLRLDSDGLLHFSAPTEASGGRLVVTAFDADGAKMGEYPIKYAVHEGQVVVTSSVGADGGEVWHPNGFFGVRVPAAALAAETELSIVQFSSGQGGIATRLRLGPGTGAAHNPLALVFPAAAAIAESDSLRKRDREACESMLSAGFVESLSEDGWDIRSCLSATFMRAFFSLVPGIDISTALNRVPDDRAEFSLEEVPADRFEIVRQPAAVLASLCRPGPGNTSCDNRAPVLLIHGLSVGGGFGGGRSVWNDLAGLLQAYDGGASRFAVYEFYYRSNARFVDIARDLDIAIRKIHAETGGRKVRLIAHSFGGLLARTRLQGLVEPVRSITPPESCASMRDPFVETLLTIGTPHSGISGTAVTRHRIRLPKGRDGLAGSTIPICRQLSCWEAGADEASGLAGSLFPEAWSALYGVAETPGEIIARLADFDSAPLGIPVRSVLSLIRGQQTAESLFGSPPGRDVYLNGDGLISFQGQRFSPALSCSDELCGDFPVGQLPGEPVDDPRLDHCVEEKVLGAGGFAFPFPGARVPAVGQLMRDYRHSRFIPHSASAIQSSISADSDFPALDASQRAIWASTHDAMNEVLDWLAPGEVRSVLELIVRGRGSVRIETQPYPVTCSSHCLVPISGQSVTLVPKPAGAAKTASISENCVMLDTLRCRMTFSGWGSTLVTFDNAELHRAAIEP